MKTRKEALEKLGIKEHFLELRPITLNNGSYHGKEYVETKSKELELLESFAPQMADILFRLSARLIIDPKEIDDVLKAARGFENARS
jgi:energy-converting hydrogenase A subunit M